MRRLPGSAETPSGPWQDLGLQVMLGVTMGSVHLALSVQAAISVSPYRTLVRTLFLLLYPAALALTGLGALLLERWPQLGGNRGLRGAGLLLLAFLGWILWAPTPVDGNAAVLAMGVPMLLTLGGWYLVLGATVAGSLHRLRLHELVSAGWAAHLLGLMLGYGLSEPLVVLVGANAAIGLTGLALLAGGRAALPVWALAQCLGLMLPLDSVLEDQRRLETLLPEPPSVFEKSGERKQESEIEDTAWMGWSRRGQVRLTTLKSVGWEPKKYRMLYNFKNQYRVYPSGFKKPREDLEEERRKGVYSVLQGAEKVIVIGAGAGRGLLSMPVALDTNVHAVERNPAAVRLFRDISPELNGGLYRRVTVHAADGRTVLERLPGGWDAIVVESSLWAPAHLLLPASAPYFHQTVEAFDVMVDRLSDDGVLILEYNRAGLHSFRRTMASRAWTALLSAGLEVRVVSSGTQVNLYVLACKTEGCGDSLQETASLRSGDRWLTRRAGHFSSPLTDDRPFMTWEKLSVKERGLLHGIAACLVLGALGLTWRERRRATDPNDWRGAPGFVLLVGIGHIALQLHAFHIARTYFEDSVRTVLVLIVLFLGWGALGSFGAGLLSRKWLQGWRWIGLALGALALHQGLLSSLPFAEERHWVRWLAAGVATAPGGLLMGVLLPLGLRRASASQLRGLVAVDAAGTLAGYALIYPIMLPWGATAFGVLAAGAFALAALLVAPLPGPLGRTLE